MRIVFITAGTKISKCAKLLLLQEQSFWDGIIIIFYFHMPILYYLAAGIMTEIYVRE